MNDRVDWCVIPSFPRRKASATREFKEKYAAWEKDFKAAQATLNSARDPESREKATQEYHKVYGQRAAFMHEEMTGFVWLYVQK